MNKIKNAGKMLYREGFVSFWHRIFRQSRHGLQFASRKLFNPNEGRVLRERAGNHAQSNSLSLSVVIPVLGQHDITRLCLKKIIDNSNSKVEILVIDNGGDFKPNRSEFSGVKIIRPASENIGVYPTFKIGMQNTTGDIVLFIHSDLIIDEGGYDVLLREIFGNDDKLGLVGFIGSDEITEFGGRGWGTTSNFAGKEYTYNGKTWKGSEANIWGYRFDGLTNAVVVDGCSMALRRAVWNEIGFRENYPMHHYYDRLISMQVLESGHKVKVLGVSCDHIGGQTADKEKKYRSTAEEWCKKTGVSPIRNHSGEIDWNISIHEEARRLFLKEWRDEKHFIPRQT